MTDEYPENCLKGLTSSDLFFGQKVRWTAFNPPDNSPVTDGWYESSINWEIDDGALPQLLNQPHPRRENELHFPAGAVRVAKAEIDRIIEDFEIQDRLGYELKPIPDVNKYHGNLLLHETLHNGKGLQRQDKAQVLGAIARAARRIQPQGEQQ